MRCGNRRKFGADRSKTKLSKNRQSMTSVYWRVGLKGLYFLGVFLWRRHAIFASRTIYVILKFFGVNYGGAAVPWTLTLSGRGVGISFDSRATQGPPFLLPDSLTCSGTQKWKKIQEFLPWQKKTIMNKLKKQIPDYRWWILPVKFHLFDSEVGLKPPDMIGVSQIVH